ncbi:hypothetical protein QE250_07060 [Chromatiaceae bacterium AAb-1]|nr:hypothetical protein [Chromatiaceae bacterium AAb-1]
MKWYWLLLISVFLTGCERIQYSQNNTPEYIASEFFEAIYNEKNLEKAKQLSTAEYAAVMESYGTVRQVSRTMFNMSFDSVEIAVNRSGQSLRQQYDTTANITLVLTGPYNGDRHDDVRTVTLVKQQGRWLVQKVQQDRFSTTKT